MIKEWADNTVTTANAKKARVLLLLIRTEKAKKVQVNITVVVDCLLCC